jgi:hypothetical protein
LRAIVSQSVCKSNSLYGEALVKPHQVCGGISSVVIVKLIIIAPMHSSLTRSYWNHREKAWKVINTNFKGVLVAMGFFPAGVQDETLKEELQTLASI